MWMSRMGDLVPEFRFLTTNEANVTNGKRRRAEDRWKRQMSEDGGRPG